MSEFDLQYWQELDKAIPGWMSENEARFLVENVQGETYMEIGVAYGKSLRIVKHHFSEMEVNGIDLINHGVREKVGGVNVFYGNANEWARKPIEAISNERWFASNTIDTLFIDGDHTYKGCLSDFVHWYNKVKPGGKIIFHDYKRDKNHEGVTLAVDAIKPLLKDFKSTEFICCGTK